MLRSAGAQPGWGHGALGHAAWPLRQDGQVGGSPGLRAAALCSAPSGTDLPPGKELGSPLNYLC